MFPARSMVARWSTYYCRESTACTLSRVRRCYATSAIHVQSRSASPQSAIVGIPRDTSSSGTLVSVTGRTKSLHSIFNQLSNYLFESQRRAAYMTAIA